MCMFLVVFVGAWDVNLNQLFFDMYRSTYVRAYRAGQTAMNRGDIHSQSWV